MKDITEIITLNSTYITMKKSKLKNNNIILLNGMFSITNLKDIDNLKVYFPYEIYKNYEDELIYEFKDEMYNLENAINNKHKIRVWSSHKDVDSYLLLAYICNYIKDKKCDLYVVYSDEYNSNCLACAMLLENEMEEITKYEHKLSSEEILKLTNIWLEIQRKNTEIRIFDNNKIKSENYEYFDEIIINKLKKLGNVKQIQLVGDLLKDYHYQDLIFVYLIDRLINKGKIKVIEKNIKNYNNIIAINDI